MKSEVERGLSPARLETAREVNMEQEKLEEERAGVELQVLPVVAGAAVGFLLAEWLGTRGILGVCLGVFVVDAFRGLRGTHQLVDEVRSILLMAKSRWQKRSNQRSSEDAI